MVLNDGNVSSVFAYYIKRKVKQKVWFNGQIPTPTEPGRRLVLAAVGSKARAFPDGDSLFGEFARRFGRPLTVTWSQTAHEVLLDNKDSVVVWVCE